MVRAALSAGFRNAGTPLEIASTPVGAVHPEANARSTSSASASRSGRPVPPGSRSRRSRRPGCPTALDNPRPPSGRRRRRRRRWEWRTLDGSPRHRGFIPVSSAVNPMFSSTRCGLRTGRAEMMLSTPAAMGPRLSSRSRPTGRRPQQTRPAPGSWRPPRRTRRRWDQARTTCRWDRTTTASSTTTAAATNGRQMQVTQSAEGQDEGSPEWRRRRMTTGRWRTREGRCLDSNVCPGCRFGRAPNHQAFQLRRCRRHKFERNFGTIDCRYPQP